MNYEHDTIQSCLSLSLFCSTSRGWTHCPKSTDAPRGLVSIRLSFSPLCKAGITWDGEIKIQYAYSQGECSRSRLQVTLALECVCVYYRFPKHTCTFFSVLFLAVNIPWKDNGTTNLSKAAVKSLSYFCELRGFTMG